MPLETARLRDTEQGIRRCDLLPERVSGGFPYLVSSFASELCRTVRLPQEASKPLSPPHAVVKPLFGGNNISRPAIAKEAASLGPRRASLPGRVSRQAGGRAKCPADSASGSLLLRAVQPQRLSAALCELYLNPSPRPATYVATRQTEISRLYASLGHAAATANKAKYDTVETGLLEACRHVPRPRTKDLVAVVGSVGYAPCRLSENPPM